MIGEHGRSRAVIEGVEPQIDGGRFPIKRVVGEAVEVEADVFADGHDVVDCVLQFWAEGDASVREVPMTPLGNDRWRGEFRVEAVGRVRYTLVAWVDRFLSWVRDLRKRSPADPDIGVNLAVGAEFVAAAAGRAVPIIHRDASPDIAAVLRLGLAAPSSALPPKPLYLRPPDAKPQAAAKVARR